MALSKSLVQQFRKNSILVGSGYRAFFAPFNKTLASTTFDSAVGPVVLDLSAGRFDTNSPPSGWYDLGWIKDFKVSPQSKIGMIRAGNHGAVKVQYRGELTESFEFKFREGTRMAWKIATGNNVFNILHGVSSTAGPVSASGAATVTMSNYVFSGGVAQLQVSSAAGLSVNNYIVCDVDYDITTFGLVGDAGIPVFQSQVVDTNYIRKTSDYVQRITAINGNILTLAGPFIGGGNGNPTALTVPQAGSKIQRIAGFAAREGSTFIMEWSALFICDTIDGHQIAQYYPHVSIGQFRDIGNYAIENIGTTDTVGYELDCVMNTLAYNDPIDGHTVLCYRAFYPAQGADISH